MTQLEDIKQMRKRHEQEIADLQATCTHPKLSGWIEEWWAPAHGTGFQVKVCEVCGEKVARRTGCSICGKLTEDPRNGIGTYSRPYGSHYCPECVDRTEEEIKSDEELQEKADEHVKTLPKGKIGQGRQL